MIYDAKQLGISKTILLGIQHLFAMFGATVLVPILTGISISSTLFFAGIGTLIFHFITKRKVPAFLGSSFAFLGGYSTIAPLTDAEGNLIDNSRLLPYACIGVAFAGLLYFVLAGLIKLFGTKRVMKFFPPIVTGPIIIAIGLTLSSSAIDSCSDNWLVAIIAIVVVIICNIFGRGMIKITPILIGVIVSYVAGICFGEVDFTKLQEASWFGLPITKSATVISILGANFDSSKFITSIITIMPIAIATIVEHVGDISAIASTTNRNYIQNPGLHRTLIGDGLATIVASIFGAPANTTYGENTGVLSLSGVYDPLVIEIAAMFAILLSFCPKFSALISLMPTAAIGGISLILYGMISAVGVRNIVENNIDFSKTRNVMISALILVLSIGIKYSTAGCISFSIGNVTIELSGIAVGAIVGIILNAVLPEQER